MARKKAPEAPPVPPTMSSPAVPGGHLYARRLAGYVREAHGDDAADTLDVSEDLGDPRAYIGWGNIAFRRAAGSDMPLGRIVEVSGMEGTGKSTALDQLLVECQRAGGLGVLADTEKSRNRQYMANLGVRPESLIWVKSKTAEGLFEEIETIARLAAHHNNKAWADALARAGVKGLKLPTVIYKVFDPATAGQKNRKPVAQWSLIQWSAEARSALMTWQKANGLTPSGIRDDASRALLRPVIVEAEDPDAEKDALANWQNGVADPRCTPADLPIILGWDSVAATCTEAELEGSARDVHPATAAKVIKLNLRRLTQLMDDQAIGLFAVNQRYAVIKMGGGPQSYGPDTEAYGGGGLKFHSTIRFELQRRGDIYAPGKPKDQGYFPIGHEVEVIVTKNRVDAPARRARYGLIYGRGAVDAYTIFSDLKDRGIIKVSGPWSAFTDDTILPGVGLKHQSWGSQWVGFEEMLNDNPQLRAKAIELYLEGA